MKKPEPEPEPELELCRVLLLSKNPEELLSFLNDLCTPKEIKSFVERWQVCQLLHSGNLSYRQINKMTGTSLTLIGRVARVLNDNISGYQTIFKKIEKNEK